MLIRKYFFGFFGFVLLIVFFPLVFRPKEILAPAGESPADSAGEILGEFAAASSASGDFSGFLPPAPAKIFLPVPAVAQTALEVSAAGAVVLDSKSGLVLFAREADTSRPIASLTKIVAALALIANHPKWQEYSRIRDTDIRLGGSSRLLAGDELTVKDLLYLCLIGSDNGAASSLAAAVGLSQEEFVLEMNRQAALFGLRETRFVDPVGLSRQNVSTPREYAVLLDQALRQEIIREAAGRKEYICATRRGRQIRLNSTNELLGQAGGDLQMLGGKTGYTQAAGYCFAGQFALPGGSRVISVIFGASQEKERFREAEKLALWAQDNYLWPE
ncbi:hypothetical protein COX69_03950 [Candidatus Falkowbacteria bacterium CG_4_10_14_0_2_um_filter_48_10]|uniref:Peptidase S11 D-alanyl-D-alanine carboxypeptidase A N-terminal domain-containing protein n=1 Tax=Candidatus Falkowbacteria bacterium CG23_combo_of_CG06-09_8_20_14_all_49_15 TaxID=1974572 RepID=A0A2G9ZNM8_9BACT|nr:MAG: hypothetical protein COX22_01705 [Candidatus Falkowbacteria bacterium CG23_combo_of_CG06-09_8_20_14_all_49_15]PJA07727.1 MAG: hypothetical protein COX69_03950 [Candidatus Falkowbacteria bacterium CG_4_10_14_0_2_um_filter_48_10]